MDFKIYRMNKVDMGYKRAFVDICFNNEIVVKGFSVVDGSNGMFVGKPQIKGKEDKWYDTFFFVMPEDFKKLEQFIINEYNKEE